MRIHRLSDKEINSLNIPVQKYEDDVGFKDFKEKAKALLGETSLNYLKYLLMLYIVIDLYSLTNNDRKNALVKVMEKMGLKSRTIEKIDSYLKLGLSTSYITLLFLNASKEKNQDKGKSKDNCKK